MPKGDNNRRLTHDQILAAVSMYTTPNPDGTWTGVKTIAAQFGVRPNAIDNHFKRLGVAKRNAKEAHANGKACKPIVNLPVGEPPLCKCGCGQRTPWHRRKNRWQAYVPGHYSQRSSQNPNWRNGSSYLPYPPDWPSIQHEIRKRDRHRCQDCGKTARESGRNLHVHHLDVDVRNNDLDNLVLLCVGCHTARHQRIRAGG